MFDSAPQGHFLRGAPGVHDQVFQHTYVSLEGLIVDRWSAVEYLRTVKPFSDIVSREIFIDRPAVRAMGEYIRFLHFI